jgi:hypothetical protein
VELCDLLFVPSRVLVTNIMGLDLQIHLLDIISRNYI